jgi:hypothetical protein
LRFATVRVRPIWSRPPVHDEVRIDHAFDVGKRAVPEVSVVYWPAGTAELGKDFRGLSKAIWSPGGCEEPGQSGAAASAENAARPSMVINAAAILLRRCYRCLLRAEPCRSARSCSVMSASRRLHRPLRANSRRSRQLGEWVKSTDKEPQKIPLSRTVSWAVNWASIFR